MTNYQQRMKKFTSATHAYMFVAIAAVVVFEPRSLVAWLLVGSTFVISYLLAVGLDAVYDSLSEQRP